MDDLGFIIHFDIMMKKPFVGPMRPIFSGANVMKVVSESVCALFSEGTSTSNIFNVSHDL